MHFMFCGSVVRFILSYSNGKLYQLFSSFVENSIFVMECQLSITTKLCHKKPNSINDRTSPQKQQKVLQTKTTTPPPATEQRAQITRDDIRQLSSVVAAQQQTRSLTYGNQFSGMPSGLFDYMNHSFPDCCVIIVCGWLAGCCCALVGAPELTSGACRAIV